ncbi:MAG: mechanosensitive ion channel family protein [Catalinimonas sp.]
MEEVEDAVKEIRLRARIDESFEAFFDNAIRHLPDVMVGLVFMLLFVGLGALFRWVFRRRVAARAEDPLLANFIGQIIFIAFTLIGAVTFLNQVNLTGAAGGLLAGAGVTAIVLGFAFRDIGENFLSGFFLAFGRPFGVGDIIEVEGHVGKVKALSLRNTRIRSFDGRDIFLPNSYLIKNPLINYTKDGLMRHDFVVGIDYGDDIAAATRLVLEELGSIDNIEHRESLQPLVVVDTFSTSTVNLRVHFWINTYDILISALKLKSEVMRRVFLALTHAGFTMPADIVELKIYQEGSPIPVAVRDLTTKAAAPKGNGGPTREG